MEAALLDGRFRVLERAGRGASGDVYRAVDETTGQQVAVKVLARTHDGDGIERFSREVRMLASVDDPHVVRYIGAGEDGSGRPFVAVEWLEGEDLRARQRRAPLDGPQALEVIRQAALGLGALHARGIVHRDIKPSNLFLSADGGSLHVTVIDLGVARIEEETLITRDGFMIGTPAYMSPEQVIGRRDLSAASDLFSLAVVLFELVARERPFVADDIVGLVAKIAIQDPPRLRQLAPGVPPALDEALAVAMAREPQNRFGSALDFATALASVPPFVVDRPVAGAQEPETKISTPSTMGTSERRVVTTVFARMPPGGDAATIQAAIDRVANDAGGTAHKLLSLAYVMVFGGAISVGDEGTRAARAALALRVLIPAAQISISTGRAITQDSNVTGDAIERGAAALAQDRGVVIDAKTARLLGDAFDVKDGVLLGEKAAAEPVRTFLGKPTPCIGRDRELSQLEALFAEVAEESVARAAIVIGEGGSGKSRVVAELVHRISTNATNSDARPRFLIAKAGAFSKAAPFGMLRSAMRSFARIQEDEPTALQRAKLTATVRDGARAALVPLVTRLAAIGDAPVRGSEDGALASDQLRVAFVTWLRELTRDGPLCLVLEDVHDGDAPSVSLIDAALANLSDVPLFVLALARPEIDARFPRLWAARSPLTLRLNKLGKRACIELTRAVVGAKAPQALVDSIVARADGNAFYLEELLRAVSDPGDADSVSRLPETVLGMVQARLDALGPASKRLLKAGAIMGGAFWPGSVAAILGDGSVQARSMRDLASQEVIERRLSSRFHGEEEYVFRHAIVLDAAYELLTEEDRSVGHERAAAWLESHGEAESIVLARHYEKGRRFDRALPYYERAAEQALVGSDFAGAIESGDAALGYGSEDFARGRVLLSMAEARRWRGELELALESAAQAVALVEPGSHTWFSAMKELVAARGRLGHSAEIVTLAELAIAQPARPDAQSAQISALVPAAVHLLYSGDRPAAEAAATRIEALAATCNELEPRARARLHQLRAALAQARDDIEVMIDENELALACFDEANDARAAALTSSNLGFALTSLGAYERAETVLTEALTLATRLGLGTIIPLAMQNLAGVLARIGQHQRALELQTRAATMFEELRDPRLESSSRVYIALLAIKMGDLERAETEANRVLNGSFEPLRVGAAGALASLRVRAGDPEGAAQFADMAAALLDRLGSVEEFEITTRVAIVESLFASRRYEDAAAALRVVRERIDTRANALRDKETRRRFLERVEEHVRVAELERLTANAIWTRA